MIEKLEIGYDCHLEAQHFEGEPPTRCVTLEYVEHSPDAWYSDSNRSVDLTCDKAQEIIDFLRKHFNLT